MPSSKVTILLSILTLFALLASCNLLDPDEPIPSYIKVKGVSLSTDYATEGTDSHNIFDLWFVHNGNIVATVPQPATVPILQEKGKEVSIYPGIKDNGTSTNRAIYPFLEPITVSIDFEPGKVYEYTRDDIVFKYKDNVKFLWLEDFESETMSLQPVISNGAAYNRTKEGSKVFEGEASLRIVMNQENNTMAVQSFDEFFGKDFSLGSPVYLEINYKNEAPLQIGYLFRSPDNILQYDDPFIYLRESEGEWRKTYINLTDNVTLLQNEASVKLYFASILASDVDRAEMLIDNIKLLTFE